MVPSDNHAWAGTFLEKSLDDQCHSMCEQYRHLQDSWIVEISIIKTSKIPFWRPSTFLSLVWPWPGQSETSEEKEVVVIGRNHLSLLSVCCSAVCWLQLLYGSLLVHSLMRLFPFCALPSVFFLPLLPFSEIPESNPEPLFPQPSPSVCQPLHRLHILPSTFHTILHLFFLQQTTALLKTTQSPVSHCTLQHTVWARCVSPLACGCCWV